MSRWARPAFSIALLVAVAIVFVASLRIRPAVFDPVGGRVFPLLIAGVLLLFLCPMLVYRDVKMASGETDEMDELSSDDQGDRADLRVASLFAAFAATTAMVAYGAIPLIAGMTMIFVVSSLLLLPPAGGGAALARPVIIILLLACALAVCTHAVFERLLGIPLS